MAETSTSARDGLVSRVQSSNTFFLALLEHVIRSVDNINKKFWEELIAYFPLIGHGPHRKRHNYGDTHSIHIIFHNIRYRGNVFTEPLPSNDKGIITEPLPNNDGGYTFLDTTQATLKTTRPTILLLLRVYSLQR
jgi:hypothetical protein